MASEASRASLTRRVASATSSRVRGCGGLGDRRSASARSRSTRTLTTRRRPAGVTVTSSRTRSVGGERLLQGGSDALRGGHLVPPSLQFVVGGDRRTHSRTPERPLTACEDAAHGGAGTAWGGPSHPPLGRGRAPSSCRRRRAASASRTTPHGCRSCRPARPCRPRPSSSALTRDTAALAAAAARCAGALAADLATIHRRQHAVLRTTLVRQQVPAGTSTPAGARHPHVPPATLRHADPSRPATPTPTVQRGHPGPPRRRPPRRPPARYAGVGTDLRATVAALHAQRYAAATLLTGRAAGACPATRWRGRRSSELASLTSGASSSWRSSPRGPRGGSERGRTRPSRRCATCAPTSSRGAPGPTRRSGTRSRSRSRTPGGCRAAGPRGAHDAARGVRPAPRAAGHRQGALGPGGPHALAGDRRGPRRTGGVSPSCRSPGST